MWQYKVLIALSVAVVFAHGCSGTDTPKYSVGHFAKHEAATIQMISAAAKPTCAVDDSGLNWSHSGDRLAFPWRQGERWGLSETNGARTTEIVTNSADHVFGVVGPSHQVVYWKDNLLFYIKDVDKPDGPTVNAFGSGIVHASFAPDGHVIACMAHTETDAGNRLAFCETPALACRFAESVPLTLRSLRWSPKGDRLSLIGGPANQQGRGESGDIYTYRLTDQKLSEVVTNRRINRYSWTWSSDGKSIYFAENGDETILVKRLWKVGVDSGTEELLADLSTLPYRILVAVPAPDGADWLLVTGENQGTHSLHLLNLPTAGLWTLATGDQWLPAWSPKGDRFAAAINGNLWLISKRDLTATLIFPTRQGDKT